MGSARARAAGVACRGAEKSGLSAAREILVPHHGKAGTVMAQGRSPSACSAIPAAASRGTASTVIEPRRYSEVPGCALGRTGLALVVAVILLVLVPNSARRLLP
jgi:hypothetical protein